MNNDICLEVTVKQQHLAVCLSVFYKKQSKDQFLLIPVYFVCYITKFKKIVFLK